jgi:hypothetical protein
MLTLLVLPALYAFFPGIASRARPELDIVSTPAANMDRAAA